MPLSYTQVTGTGAQMTVSFAFNYLLKSHVKVYLGYDILDGTYGSELVDGVGFNWTGANQIQTTAAVAQGTALTVIRRTPSSSRLVDWQDGGKLTADDLDTADLQNLYVVQEQQDRVDASSALSAATADAVSDVLLYQSIATVAAIPASPANGDRIEVFNSTGIESFSPLSGLPPGFVGSPQTIARLSYTTTGNTWTWVEYRVPDPDARYVKLAAISSSTSSASSTNVASSLAVKTAKDAADVAKSTADTAQAAAGAAQTTANAALPKAGGTMTGDVTFSDSGEGVVFSDASKITAISNSTSSASSTVAASSTAVKTAKDLLDALDAGLVGAVMAFAANAAPSGWAKCNGASVSRTGTYARLWTFAQASGNLAASEGAKQAGQFGPGNGSSTFTLPDLRGEFLRGWADDRAVDTGRSLGTAQGDDYKQHTHSIDATTTLTGAWNAYSFESGGGSGIVSSSISNSNEMQAGTSTNKNFNAFAINANHSHTAGGSPTTGGAETRPRNVALLYCIKY